MKLKRETARGYIYFKPIFWVMFIIIISLILSIFYRHNFDVTPDLYFKCEKLECDNPFYLTECKARVTVLFFIPLYTSNDCRNEAAYSWLDEPKLPRGEYGTPEPDYFLYNNISLISFIIFVLAIFLNHIIFNRGKKFDIEIPVTKKLIINRDWLEERARKSKETGEDEEYKNN